VSVTSEPATTAAQSDAFPPRMKFIAAATLACYWLAMFIGTHTPLPQLERLPKFSDKLMHLGAYCGLAFLFGLWRASKRGWSGWSPVAVVTIVALYGIADELLQKPVNRTADVVDWTADLIGAIGGVALLAVLQKRLRGLFSSIALLSGVRAK
jgi:VanZ family protein